MGFPSKKIKTFDDIFKMPLHQDHQRKMNRGKMASIYISDGWYLVATYMLGIKNVGRSKIQFI